MPSGTLTADGTEQTIDTLTPAAPGVVFWYIDLENMVSGDTVVIRERVDVDGDGTYEIFNTYTYTDAQVAPVISQSENLMTDTGLPVRITLEQTAGTNRSYPWQTGVNF